MEKRKSMNLIFEESSKPKNCLMFDNQNKKRTLQHEYMSKRTGTQNRAKSNYKVRSSVKVSKVFEKMPDNRNLSIKNQSNKMLRLDSNQSESNINKVS